jgi:hypothetical protein
MKVKCYTELSRLTTFEERYSYLRLDGVVGKETFGFERYLNQVFYCSKEWKAVRDLVIIRDCGRDLGVPGYEIHGHILIHHLNPISVEDIERRTLTLLNPEYLICTTHNTHNAIHYGDADLLIKGPIQRTKNDTCPWRH